MSADRRAIGLIGAAILFVGVFAPVVSYPIAGSVNYFHNGSAEGVIVLAFAVASAIAIGVRRFGALWYTGIGSLGVLGYGFFHLHSKIANMKRGVETQLSGNPLRGLADAALGGIQLQWGWGILALGAVMVLIAAGMKEPREQAAPEPSTAARVPTGPGAPAPPTRAEREGPSEVPGEARTTSVLAACSFCGEVAKLSEAEIASRQFVCRYCGRTVPLQIGPPTGAAG